MRVAFVHSHKFRFDGTKYYSTGGLSENVLSRYIKENDIINVYGRLVTAKVNENLSVINDERIHINNLKKVNLKKELEKADIIIIRLPCYIGFKACSIANELGKRYFVEVVGSCWDALWYYGIRGKILANYMEKLMKKSVLTAPYACYVTQEYLQNKYPCKGKTTGCSDVEMPQASTDVLKERLYKIEKFKCNNNVMLGTMGAIDVKYKSQETVIKALGLLKKHGYDNFYYQLVGGGKREYLLKIAQEEDVEKQIEFLGTIPHDNVFEWLDSLDIYIQPSKVEGLPRALLEAMSRACPTIGSQSGGIPELVEREYSFSHGKDSIEQLCNIILNSNKENLKNRAIRNYNLALEYQPAKLRQQWIEFYNQFYYFNNGDK